MSRVLCVSPPIIHDVQNKRRMRIHPLFISTPAAVRVRPCRSLSLSEWLLRRQVPHSLLPPSPPASHCGTTFRSRTVSNCRFSLLSSLCSYPNELPAAAAEEGGREGEIGQSIRECTHSGARGGAAGDKSASLTDGGFLRRHRKGRKDRRRAASLARKLHHRQESFVISGELLDGVGGREGGQTGHGRRH